MTLPQLTSFLETYGSLCSAPRKYSPGSRPRQRITFTAAAMNHRESVCSGRFQCCALWVTGALENWVSRGFTSSQILQSQGYSVKESRSLLSNPRPLPSSVDKLNTYHKDDLYSLARINEPFKNSKLNYDHILKTSVSFISFKFRKRKLQVPNGHQHLLCVFFHEAYSYTVPTILVYILKGLK